VTHGKSTDGLTDVIGQYVYEMTNTRIRVLAEPSANNGTAAVAASATNGAMDVDMDADEEDVEE